MAEVGHAAITRCLGARRGEDYARQRGEREPSVVRYDPAGKARQGVRLRVRRETGKVTRMKESYGEGLAPHTGPESCVSTREGNRAVLRPGGEALTGVRIGRVLSRERALKLRGPTSYGERKATRSRALQASPRPPLRGLRPRACAESPCTGTGRPPVRSRHEMAGVIRGENPKGVMRR